MCIPVIIFTITSLHTMGKDLNLKILFFRFYNAKTAQPDAPLARV